MNIFLTGGTGFIGKTLTKKLTGEGHRMTLLTRAVRRGAVLPRGASFFEGNPNNPGPWQEEMRKHEVVINLVGASIYRRWNKKVKKEIFDSRILATRHIIDALEDSCGKVLHLLSASAVGYYGFHGDELLDESAPAGDDFLATVASAWESEAQRAENFGVSVVCCRFGLVLGKRGGALSRMITPFRLGLGSRLGSGKQWLSWIHEQDLANIFVFLLEQSKIKGPVNCTSHSPVRNKELTAVLARTLNKPVFLPPIPGFILRPILGEFSKVFIKGQRVFPKVLLERGFNLQFPAIREALQDLIGSQKTN